MCCHEFTTYCCHDDMLSERVKINDSTIGQIYEGNLNLDYQVNNKTAAQKEANYKEHQKKLITSSE